MAQPEFGALGATRAAEPLDPFTVEVIRSALDAICERMSSVLERTAYSTLIRDILDFSTALFDTSGRIIAQSARIPSHLNTMGPALQEILAKYIPIEEWRPGDAVIMNDPYHGGQHLPDIFIMVPIFHEGRNVAIAGCMGHHVDIGGRSAGSFAGDASDIFQEGLRIPPLKMYDQGVPNRAFLDLFATNVREPTKGLGDLAAQVAALRVGEREFQGLVGRYGVRTIVRAVGELLEYLEIRMRKRIAEIADGTYAWEDVIDDDGVDPGPFHLRASMTIAGSEMTVDFTGTDPQVRGPINCMIGMTLGTVYYVAVAALDPDIPKNYGCYVPITVIAPLGTLVNPRSPAPVVGRVETAHRLVDLLLGCLAQAIPTRVMAPYYGATNHIMVSGEDEATGSTWIAFEIQPGGWGGRPTLDGNDGLSAHLHNVQNVPVEVEEATYPLRIDRYELIPNSGGAGTFRGGLGIRRDIRILAPAAQLTIHCDRFTHSPKGMLGGEDGVAGRCIINPGTPEERHLGSKATNVRLVRGDVVRFESQGGAGYGSPAGRNPELTAGDRRAGKVGPAAGTEPRA